MSRSQPLDRWTDQVRMAFLNLSRPQATVLALYSFGMFLAQRCGLSSVVVALVPVLAPVSNPPLPASRVLSARYRQSGRHRDDSAAAEATLFARFSATLGRSDFSLALIVGYGLRPSRRGPDHDWWGLRWRSPGSQVEGFCACQGLRRRGAGWYLAITTRTISPSVGRKTSAPRTCLTPLNT